ncbi:MAG: response regulator transcription factor [Deltaproteobacteria bacterium]|nr:response regulator transcription factor [Deltaproteobacteria bacterium]
MSPKDQVKIILADDHAMVRRGIKKILQEKPELIVTDEASDGQELLDKLETVTPDLVIVDISMPRMGGLEAAAQIKCLHPGVKILILTMHRDKEFLEKAMEIGVDGYILKEKMDVDLPRAMEYIFAGKTYTSPLLR